MTIKTLSAIAILTTALSSPVFAQDVNDGGMAYQQQSPYALRDFRNVYNRVPDAYVGPRSSEDWFTQTYGIDRSRVGSRDPDFNPAD
jgi:hypothetical protein